MLFLTCITIILPTNQNQILTYVLEGIELQLAIFSVILGFSWNSNFLFIKFLNFVGI